MKTVVLPKTGKSVNIPATGLDWELFTSSMACGTAARALTAGLMRALREIDAKAAEGYGPTAETLNKLYRAHIEPVMLRYSKYGACDSEPRNHALFALERGTLALTGLRIETWA